MAIGPSVSREPHITAVTTQLSYVEPELCEEGESPNENNKESCMGNGAGGAVLHLSASPKDSEAHLARH